MLTTDELMYDTLDSMSSVTPSWQQIVLRSILGPDSTFRKTSDALLQYVCGRHAETIQHRPTTYKARNKHFNKLLHIFLRLQRNFSPNLIYLN